MCFSHAQIAFTFSFSCDVMWLICYNVFKWLLLILTTAWLSAAFRAWLPAGSILTLHQQSRDAVLYCRTCAQQSRETQCCTAKHALNSWEWRSAVLQNMRSTVESDTVLYCRTCAQQSRDAVLYCRTCAQQLRETQCCTAEHALNSRERRSAVLQNMRERRSAAVQCCSAAVQCCAQQAYQWYNNVWRKLSSVFILKWAGNPWCCWIITNAEQSMRLRE